MKIKARAKIFVNGKETLVKTAVAKYKGLAGHIDDFRKMSKSVARLSDNGIMTSSQEFTYSSGDTVRVEIHTKQ